MTASVEIIDQCVADVRAGRRTLEECLAAHPTERDELSALLPVALALATAPQTVAPDPARKLQARYAFVEAIHREGRRAEPRGWVERFLPHEVRYRLATAFAAALAVVAALGGGAVVAAQDALPGDVLYGLKTAIEHQQVALASSEEARAWVRLSIASRRLQEIDRAAERGRGDAALLAATTLAETLLQVQADMEVLQARGQPVAEVGVAFETAVVRGEDALVRASGLSSANIDALLARSRRGGRGTAQRDESGASTPAPTTEPTPADRSESRRGDEGRRERGEQLQQDLLGHLDAARSALERGNRRGAGEELEAFRNQLSRAREADQLTSEAFDELFAAQTALVGALEAPFTGSGPGPGRARPRGTEDRQRGPDPERAPEVREIGGDHADDDDRRGGDERDEGRGRGAPAAAGATPTPGQPTGDRPSDGDEDRGRRGSGPQAPGSRGTEPGRSDQQGPGESRSSSPGSNRSSDERSGPTSTPTVGVRDGRSGGDGSAGSRPEDHSERSR